MFRVVEETFNKVHNELCDLLVSNHRESAPRGVRVYELPHPVAYTQVFPMECWLTAPGRSLNPFFAAAEVFWILSGDGSVAWISRFLDNIKKFADPGKLDFNAPYGKRIFRYDTRSGVVNQVDRVVHVLTKDPLSRQAVICLWHVDHDNVEETNDRACNNLIYFSAHDNRLSMTVCQRSNDLYFGTPYNAIQFAHLQMLVADSLGLPLGTRTQFINNLHVYRDQYYNVGLEELPKADDDCVGPGFVVRRPISQDRISNLVQWIDWSIWKIKQGRYKEVEFAYEDYWTELASLPVFYYMYKRKDIDLDGLYKTLGKSRTPLWLWLATDYFESYFDKE